MTSSSTGIRQRRKVVEETDRLTDDRISARTEATESKQTAQTTSTFRENGSPSPSSNQPTKTSPQDIRRRLRWLIRTLIVAMVGLYAAAEYHFGNRPATEKELKRIKRYYRWLFSHADDKDVQTLQILRPYIQELYYDDETASFCNDTPRMPYIKYKLRRYLQRLWRLLHWGASDQDVAGWLRGNPMYVLSSTHVGLLLDNVFPTASTTDTSQRLRMLDVGAGDGAVTQRFVAAMTTMLSNTTTTGTEIDKKGSPHVTCVEISTGLQSLIRQQRRWKAPSGEALCNEVLGELPSSSSFDLVTMLNVLDRVHDPASFLARVQQLVQPGTGRLVLAQVSPYRASVATGTGWEKGRKAFRALKSEFRDDRYVKRDARVWIREILEPHGWVVESVSKVPYLSMRHAFASTKFAILTDLVFVLQRRQPNSTLDEPPPSPPESSLDSIEA